MWKIFRFWNFIYWLIGCCNTIDNGSNQIENGQDGSNQIENGQQDGSDQIENGQDEHDFSFNETLYDSSIVGVNNFDDMFDLYISSRGKTFLFRNTSGEIWIITIHFDRNQKLKNGLIECLPPTSIRHKPDGIYLWSSFNNRNYDWGQFIINEKGVMLDFFMGDVYFVATKLNDPTVPVCFINSAKKLAVLDQEFGACTDFDLHYNEGKKSNFDWPRFYEQYGSLIILDYYWEHRLSIDWYYGFDCTTGLHMKMVSSNGSPVVKVQKLTILEIHRLFYDKISKLIQFKKYKVELRIFNDLQIFAFDNLFDSVRDCYGSDRKSRKIRRIRSVYSVSSQRDTDITAPSALLKGDVNYHFAIQKWEATLNGSVCYYFNFTKLAIADLVTRVIFNGCSLSSFKFAKLITLVNRDYRKYVDVDLLDINLLSTHYDQNLMKLVYNILQREN